MGEVRMNPALTAELERSPQVAAMLKARVEAAAAAARQLAPVGDPATDPTSGRFRASIRAEVVVDKGRVAGRVLSDDPAAPYIIHGTSDTPAHDTLMRGVEATIR